MAKKFNKNYGPYSRVQIAEFYGWSNETFRKICIKSGLTVAMPDILKRRNPIFHKDKATIEQYLGPSRWGDYIGEK